MDRLIVMTRQIFLVFLCICLAELSAYTQQDRFYTPADGLSGTQINSITEDSRGYLWISTYAGLNRFDGYNFKVYQYSSADTTSLNSTDVYLTFEDSHGNLWVGTNNGLNLYNYQKDNFRRITFPFIPDSYEIEVRSMVEDGAGFLWIVSSHGLIRLDPSSLESDLFNVRFDNDGVPSPVSFSDGVFDTEGNLWIAAGIQGVLVFIPSQKKFVPLYEYTDIAPGWEGVPVGRLKKTREGEIMMASRLGQICLYDLDTKKITPLESRQGSSSGNPGLVSSIAQDREGNIWIGTNRNGLFRVDRSLRTVEESNEEIGLDDIDRARVLCYAGGSGNLWFGIHYRGIYLKVPKLQPFESIKGFRSDHHNLTHYLIQSVMVDRHSTLWVGTDGGGLNYRTEGEEKFRFFDRLKNTNSGLPVGVIMCMLEDSRGWIWMGTYMEGLYCYSGDNAPPIRWPILHSESHAQISSIYDIKEDARGNLWLGTQGGSLIYLDVSTGESTFFGKPVVNGVERFIDPYINEILVSSDGTLWLATYDGLFAWNAQKDYFQEFSTRTGDLDNDAVFTLAEDDAHEIWFGTFSGLHHLDRYGTVDKKYTRENGLSHNTVMALQMGERGDLWISTSNGISRLDIRNRLFTNFYEYDGLPCNEFKPSSSFRDRQGRIYFGGVKGLVYFHPDSIVPTDEIPRLLFTGFKIFDQDIVRGTLLKKRVVLENILNETDTIRIPYADNYFTFEFTSIEYFAPEKIRYAVRMDGFDKEWNVKGYRERYATYTNLSPGTYVFQVRSTNRDGLWMEHPREITVIIEPPFWLTWWAFILYILLLTSVSLLLRSVMLFRMKMRNQLYLVQLERKKQEEISQSKMQFFANISHEIKTPLTMILAPLEKLDHSGLREDQKKQFDYIRKNTRRLVSLVNQFLEIQKKESGLWEIRPQKTDIIGFLRGIVPLFEGMAEEKDIEISFEPQCEKLEAWVDQDKMDKIIFNLLSNALKYTPNQGYIILSVACSPEGDCESPEGGTYEISVLDNGIGISQEHLSKIFERFYQVKLNDSNCQAGTGIGLHLVKQLVDMHYGQIRVESREGEGSRFVLNFPLGSDHFRREDLLTEDLGKTENHSWLIPNIASLERVLSVEGVRQPLHEMRPVLLIVEDDPDILDYIENEFSTLYEVIKANNGMEAWKVAQEKMPDLIISDVMMPGMDGIAFCQKVKTSFETSHIPVILLTASSSVEREIEGYETGADAYIHKPFHPSLLELQVRKILERRERLRKQFSSGGNFTAKEMAVTSSDERFLQRAIDYVKDNMSDSTLSTEKMSLHLGVSRVHLYRKLKALTNQVPTEFIRTLRLKQAAYLLSQKKLNVSEIAYKVGFNSHQYFTNCFQKHFNMSPSEYSKQNESGEAGFKS